MTQASLNASFTQQHIRSYFQSFNYFSFTAYNQQRCLRIPPGKGFILLVKHGELKEKNKETTRLGPGSYFGTPHINYRYLEALDGAELLWMELEPTTLFQLSGRFINTFYGSIVPLNHLLSVELDAHIFDFRFLDKTSLLDWFHYSLFQKIRMYQVPGCVEGSLKAFIKFESNLSISSLCEQLQVNRRSFERKFRQVIGLSPKHYWRINRLSHAISLLKREKVADLQDIVFQCGYFDQSHFIRDFKDFTGQTPKKYLLATG